MQKPCQKITLPEQLSASPTSHMSSGSVDVSISLFHGFGSFRMMLENLGDPQAFTCH